MTNLTGVQTGNAWAREAAVEARRVLYHLRRIQDDMRTVANALNSSVVADVLGDTASLGPHEQAVADAFNSSGVAETLGDNGVTSLGAYDPLTTLKGHQTQRLT
jgi:hypothetical protein